MAYEPIPEGYADAIGQLVISISRLDSVIIDLMAIFADTDILRAMTAFSHFQTTSKIDTLTALANLGSTDDEIKKGNAFTKALKQARELCDYRNTIVHAYWDIDDTGTVSTVRFAARGKFKRTKTPVASQEILLKAGEVGVIESKLRGLRDHMHQTKSGDPQNAE